MLGDSFAQDLADLQTVTLETSDELKSDPVQVLLESLRSTCRVPVRHRTCGEAHKVALQAKQSPSRSGGAGPLSPFWCLEREAPVWSPSRRFGANW